NEAQSEVSARIISAPDDSNLVFNGYALIPTDCGYTNEQLAYQVDGLVRQLVGLAEDFYDAFNPTRALFMPDGCG
ncbi:TPA: hypothetical protein OTT42_002332, partial [Corynebacterium striatum]|nr:hypothetical protein [Corynebacterium striatum]